MFSDPRSSRPSETRISAISGRASRSVDAIGSPLSREQDVSIRMAARPSIPHGSILDVCKSTSRDLIVFDLMMPEMDGFAVVALQKKAGWRDTPVIVITSLDFGLPDFGWPFLVSRFSRNTVLELRRLHVGGTAKQRRPGIARNLGGTLAISGDAS